MGLYLSPPTSTKMTWLALHAEPLPLTLANKLAHFPWEEDAEKICLAYAINAADWDILAVMHSKQEFLRWQDGRPDATYYSAPKALVEEILGQKL